MRPLIFFILLSILIIACAMLSLTVKPAFSLKDKDIEVTIMPGKIVVEKGKIRGVFESDIYGKIVGEVGKGNKTILIKIGQIEMETRVPEHIFDEIKKIIGNFSKVQCFENSDCVHAPVCCHQGAAKCISINEYRPIECGGVFCTMECRSCTACLCVKGKCETVKVGGCC